MVGCAVTIVQDDEVGSTSLVSPQVGGEEEGSTHYSQLSLNGRSE